MSLIPDLALELGVAASEPAAVPGSALGDCRVLGTSVEPRLRHVWPKCAVAGCQHGGVWVLCMLRPLHGGADGSSQRAGLATLVLGSMVIEHLWLEACSPRHSNRQQRLRECGKP